METEKNELQKERDEIYISKFEYYNLLLEKLEKSQQFQFKYKLVIDEQSQKESLGEIKIYVEKILKYFWESPKLTANLLLNANLDDVKNNLSHLIINNFYENILSPNDREYHLIYIMTTLLKHEINNLNDEYCNPDNFLSDSLCSILFDEFYLKDKIQYFCKKVFLDLIEISETEYSSQDLTFNLNQIENIVKLQNGTSKNGKFPQRKNSKNKNGPIDKHIFDLTEKILVEKRNQFEKEKKEEMKDYIDINLVNCLADEKENIYSSYDLINALKDEGLEIYWNNFSNIKILMNKFIDNLSNNLHKLPYLVKCICKIIKILIINKYKAAPVAEQNAFISKFFFGKLLVPFFKDTALLCLINEYIISDSTKKNLLTIKHILSKFFNSKFFRSDIVDDKYYIPLNSYFIEKMPEIINLYKKITEVNLPNFVDQIIKEEIDDEKDNIFDFAEEGEDNNDEDQFDFYEKNIEEILFYRNICFSVDEVITLVNNLDRNKEKLLQDEKNDKIISLKKSIEKILNDHNKNKIKKMLNSNEVQIGPVKRRIHKSRTCDGYSIYALEKKIGDEHPKGDGNKKSSQKEEKNCFILSELLFRKGYEKLLSGGKIQKKFFYRKEIKNPKTDEDIEKNNIIKVENLFCTVLYYFKEINSIDFDEEKTGDILSILRELKKYMNSDFVTFDCVPSEWYLNSLISNIKKLPEELKENDLEKIFDELTNDIKASIKEYEFGLLSKFSNAINNMKNYKQYRQKAKEITTDLNLNIKLQEIITKENIPVAPILKDGNLYLKLIDKKKPSIIGNLFSKSKSNKTSKTSKDAYYTIENFINDFPDFTEINDNVLKILKNLDVPQILIKYFDKVNEHIKNMKIAKNDQELEHINDKIYDYVMEKLYSKIFPKNPTDEDKKIYEMSIKIQWIDLKNLSKDSDDFNFEEFLPQCIQYFNDLDKEKSPRKKILSMEKIFVCIEQLSRFSGKKIEGVDGILPVVNYVMIKAKQKRMDSNCNFIDLFLDNKKNGIEGNHLMQLILASKKIATFSINDMNDVCESDYLENCRLSELNILY